MWRRSILSALGASTLWLGSFAPLAPALLVPAMLSGCNNAPTLPLPPPVVDVGSPNAQGLVAVSGEVSPQAYVSIFNERTESGLIIRADRLGDFEVEIEAEVGDLITVWAEINGEIGERKHAIVPPPRPTSP